MTGNDFLKPLDIEIIGKDEVVPEYFDYEDKTSVIDGIVKTCSDHYGLFAKFSFT